ncbi:MAG: hypothetical protein L6R41_007170 [Letrouitia leprolyta]|nr:MAG: hypothetical protein L6R41_007170 [Letrouitia leprolyta]
MSQASSSSSARSTGPSEENGIRIIPKNEHKAAADCLAEAFREDDVAQYFVQTADTEKWTEDERWTLHVRIMRSIVLAHCIKGLALTAGPNYDCVALWMPPGKTMDDQMTMFRSGMWTLNFKLSRDGRRRFHKEFLPLLHYTKSEVLGDLDNNSWYLVYIGTKPGAQKKGYARMLIEYVTNQADAKGHACYLESSNDVNPAYYRKFGFQTVRRIQLTSGLKPVDLDIMVRQPVSKNSSQDNTANTNIVHHGQTAATA